MVADMAVVSGWRKVDSGGGVVGTDGRARGDNLLWSGKRGEKIGGTRATPGPTQLQLFGKRLGLGILTYG